MRLAARVIARYAGALADVTLERGNADLVLGELEQFAGLMRASAEARVAFASPAISRGQRARALEAVLARLNPAPETANFLRLLSRNRRMGALDDIIDAFRAELDRRRGIVTAEITTARDIGEKERRSLVESLERATGKTVRPQWKLDPSLIGGASIKLGDRVIDGSVRAQLEQIRRRMTETPLPVSSSFPPTGESQREGDVHDAGHRFNVAFGPGGNKFSAEKRSR
ncbi:MAG TPA: ATP synthase F1 subunit delta [Blastocatellia bacterium]